MFIEQATSLLRQHHQKTTKTRLWLLTKLSDVTHPVNPYELLEQEPDAQIDITTIYRNLELFESLGIVHKIHTLGGYMPCLHSHSQCTKTHDLIICNNCNSINETHIDLDTKKLLGLSDGPVELSGECTSCEQKK